MQKTQLLQRPKLPLILGIEFLCTEHFAGHGRKKVAKGVVRLAFSELLVNMLHAERDVRHGKYPLNALRKSRFKMLEQDISTQKGGQTKDETVHVPLKIRRLMVCNGGAQALE